MGQRIANHRQGEYGDLGMTLVHAVVDVDAPPDVVWKVVADPRNLPYWDRHIAKVQDVPDDGLKEGVEYFTEVRLAGVHARIDARVEEMREPEYSRIRLSGPVDAVVTTRLFPIEDGRTRLEHAVDY